MATNMKTKNNETTINYDELLPLQEVADRCNIGMRLLREAIGRREIRVVKFTGRIWRIRESDRLAWVERKSKGALK
jgi:excisionase family DNA binding protein